MAIVDITKPMALDETLQGTNTKMDAVILKLQGIIDALGLDTSVYKPKGNITCAALIPALLIDDNLGNVYNVTDNGTTTSDFVEGAGKPIHVGDNVAIVDIGTGGQSEYKFDLLAGMVDLTNYVQKSQTAGLLKNDGTVDTKDYAEKVAGATGGNLAGLNGSGNLTDSGISGDMTTQSASGNPISIADLKSAQIALNPVITFEPIQAGSGTPSPSNIRAISGYDKIEALSCGVNAITKYQKGGIENDGTENSNTNTCRTDFIKVIPNGAYYFIKDTALGGSAYYIYYDQYKNFISYNSNLNTGTLNIPNNVGYVRFQFYLSGSGWGTNLPNRKDGLNYPATQTSYVAPHKTTDLSESLGQTVYKGSLDVRTGLLTVTHKEVDLSTLTWTFYSNQPPRYASNAISDIKVPASNSIKPDAYCSNFEVTAYNSFATGKVVVGQGKGLVVGDSNSPTGQFIYELATPFTIQLTPHEIALSQGYNYISTNGTSISLAYHNGEVATHADVEQLAETVNELGNRQPRRIVIEHNWGNVTSGTRYDYNVTENYSDITPNNLIAVNISIPEGVSVFDYNGKCGWMIYQSKIFLQYVCAVTQNNARSKVYILYYED